MRILHTESSSGWGGQEIRILREAQGLRARGHEVVFAVAAGGGLVAKARKEGFTVYEIGFKRSRALFAIYTLIRVIQKNAIDLVVTHSSLDAWLGGIAARISGRPVVRLRHLSTPTRAGLNSFLLYKKLADFVVTTSTKAAALILEQTKLPMEKCVCVPTGVEPNELQVDPLEVKKFRERLGLSPEDCLVGTACFVRSWKGIGDFLKAAALLKEEKNIKWVVIGGGYIDQYKPLAKELGVEENVTFVGHMDAPFAAIAALDLFLLLSTAHEGISQASLQAAFLERPLITTPVGGLPEVCLDGQTGLIVPPFSPERIAEMVRALAFDPKRRRSLGAAGKKLVEEKFTFTYTLDQMERIYTGLFAAGKA